MHGPYTLLASSNEDTGLVGEHYTINTILSTRSSQVPRVSHIHIIIITSAASSLLVPLSSLSDQLDLFVSHKGRIDEITASTVELLACVYLKKCVFWTCKYIRVGLLNIELLIRILGKDGCEYLCVRDDWAVVGYHLLCQ